MRPVIMLTHANIPDTLVEVHTGQIFAKYFSNAHKSTLVLSVGGALLPVRESLEQINALIAGANDGAGTTKGE